MNWRNGKVPRMFLGWFLATGHLEYFPYHSNRLELTADSPPSSSLFNGQVKILTYPLEDLGSCKFNRNKIQQFATLSALVLKKKYISMYLNIIGKSTIFTLQNFKFDTAVMEVFWNLKKNHFRIFRLWRKL